jgi:fructose-1,6-bisphosphatase I
LLSLARTTLSSADAGEGGAVSNARQIGERLEDFLSASAPADISRALLAFAWAALPVADLIRRGPLAGPLDAAVGPSHDGVAQKALDAFADEAIIEGLKGAGVRGLVSEERDDPVSIDAEGTLLAAIDPLDGSSNIDANVSLGSILSLLDAPAGDLKAAHFLQPGLRQRAAAFVIYGLHVACVFTTGAGVSIAALDPDAGDYRMSSVGTRMPVATNEFAINASNSRRWPQPVRDYVEDLVEGEDGPRGKAYNMRWTGTMIAEAYRILLRGGVYLYPQDSREGYGQGRLRLIYEANPVALLVEQAGGAAIDGFHRILEIEPRSIHARTPLIFGSQDKVERVAAYYREESVLASSLPLFGKRGLLRR